VHDYVYGIGCAMGVLIFLVIGDSICEIGGLVV